VCAVGCKHALEYSPDLGRPQGSALWSVRLTQHRDTGFDFAVQVCLSECARLVAELELQAVGILEEYRFSGAEIENRRHHLLATAHIEFWLCGCFFLTRLAHLLNWCHHVDAKL
jgi:hypothetical protein